MLEGNKLRKILRNKKALSPVIAAIILVAVTVAVSIAVAVWMGSLTLGFMETEQITITNVAFSETTDVNDIMTVYLQNTGTTDVLITGTATVSGYGVAGASTTAATVGKGESGEFTVALSGTWSEGSAYSIELLSSKGNKFSHTATSPS